MLSICVQCALQVFNITPFTQSSEALQSCSAREKNHYYTGTKKLIAQNIAGGNIVGSYLYENMGVQFACKCRCNAYNKASLKQ